ncbi:MAG: hypothetical protein IJI46_09840 [Erysipelotrichaceae bacterium]|nr:hypothetical protein [Erysipelotrichaceae bacterium]
MKKLIIQFLSLIMIFTCFSYALIFDHQHGDEDEQFFHVHIHEINAIDHGTCPNCGEPRTGYIVSEATCTTNGLAYAYCNIMGCMNWGMEEGIIIPALGHDFSVLRSVTEPTCIEGGVYVYECSRCSATTSSYPAALGHNYKSKVTKEATCTEDGIRTYTCSRCNDRYTRKIEALGHDMQTEEVEPTCTDEGQIEAVCKRCNETVIEKTAALGHKYPKEWTREKDPSYTTEGLEYKLCERCGDRIEQTIPRLDMTPVLVTDGGSVAAVAAAAGLWRYLARKKKLAKKALEKMKPDFEDKTLVFCSSDEELLKKLKDKDFLQINACEYEDLETCVEENEPVLIFLDVMDDERLDDLWKKREGEALSSQTWAYLVGKEYLDENKEKLDGMVEAKEIIAYGQHGAKPDTNMVKLVLPVLKPNMKSDEQLGNIGMIADALGIPGISSLIDVYLSGRDIKATLESEEIGVSETATIISDIASILGLDNVASVAGLVGDVDSIKAALDKEAGANEKKSGIDGAKDIVEVVSDVISKD